MYGTYVRNSYKTPETVTPTRRSGSIYREDLHLSNQSKNSSALLPNLPKIKGTNAMGNTLKNTKAMSPVGRYSSSSNSVISRNSKLSDNFECGGESSVVKCAGKSHDTTSTLNGSVKLRRNSSDSGYNSSGKACETGIDARFSGEIQRANLHTSCGNNNHAQFSKNKSSTHNCESSLPPSSNNLERHNLSVNCGRKEASSGRSSRKTSLDLENTKPRSYVRDTCTSKSPMSIVSEGLVGLQNLGNTCFMNSILQCLSNCQPLRDKLLSVPFQCNIKSKTKGKLYLDFADLIKAMWSKSTTKSSVSPHTFKTQFQRFCPRFVGYEQQDSQEFLRCLLEGLNEDLNKAASASRRSGGSSPDLSKLGDKALADHMWDQYKTRDDSLITELFCGQIMSTLTCTKCNHRSVTFDPFWDLSLSIPRRSYYSSSRYSDSSVTLLDCLSLFTKKEELDGDEKPKCEKCKTRQRCEKQFKIHRFPKILVIHLKRFSGFGFRSKLQTDVDFPLSLSDMSDFASNHSDEFFKRGSTGVQYNLFAVSNHSGSAYGGHYTAYCKHPESQKWYSFNDSRVSPLSASSVRGSQAYVLFYERAEIQM